MKWEKGQSGNPAGRPLGSRHKLSERFIKNLHQDWKVHGAEAIAAVRESSPAEYLKLVASLVPKEAQFVGQVTHQRGYGSVSETEAFLERVLGEFESEKEQGNVQSTEPKTLTSTPVHLVPRVPEEEELKPSA